MNRIRPRVLIVEDEPFVAQMATKLLEHWGLDSMIATTVAGARTMLDVPFDLFLIDLMLTDGCGIEVLKSIREHEVAGRAVIWTARPMQDLESLFVLKPDRILSKPRLDELESLADEVKADFAARGTGKPGG